MQKAITFFICILFYSAQLYALDPLQWAALNDLNEQYQLGWDSEDFCAEQYIIVCSNSGYSVKQLSLSNMNLTQELPNSIGNLKHLKRLSLVGNLFTDLPPSLSNLVNLESLSIDGNLNNLPDYIFGFSKLKGFAISNGNIHEVPEQITQLTQLSSFHTVHNEIEIIPSYLISMKQIKRLHFSNNKIKEIPPEINLMENLSLF